MPWYGGGRRYYGGNGGCGCLGFVVIAIFVGVALVSQLANSGVFRDGFFENSDYSYDYADGSYDAEWDSYIGESTRQREAIDKELGEETAWYQDNNSGADRWIHDVATLEDSLQYFFDRTGVRPYLLINTQEKSVEVLEMDDNERFYYVEEMYEELFADGAHALFVISDDGDDNWRYDDYVGAQALLVMDYEAVNILYDCFDYNWTTDMAEEELFANSFRETADRIMGPDVQIDPAENPEEVTEVMLPEEDSGQTSEENPEKEPQTEPEPETKQGMQIGSHHSSEKTTTATRAPDILAQMKDGLNGITDRVDKASVSGETKNYIALALVIIVGAVAIAAMVAWRKRQDARERDGE